MGRIVDALSWLVTVRPVATLAALFAVTIFFAAGIAQLAPQSADESFFLPQDSEITKALEDLENLFSDSASVTLVTLLFRGEAFTPQGWRKWTVLSSGCSRTRRSPITWRLRIQSYRLLS